MACRIIAFLLLAIGAVVLPVGRGGIAAAQSNGSVYPGTFTYHNDNFRTGQNLNETVLAPANVNSATFGKLFSYALDGLTFASPLYAANVNIPSNGFHNVVFVATEHDSVYAFDADGLTNSPLWQASFINPAAGVTPVPAADTLETGDIPNEIGITGTPVIDPTNGTLYLVAKTKEISGSATNYVQRLHALDIATGTEKFGGPVVIQGSVSGTGPGSQAGLVTFNALRQNQRTALLLANGVVYFGFSSHGDNPPYYGWVLGFNPTNLQQVLTYNDAPNAGKGGIWMNGDGLACDSTGNLYSVTGDGIFDANTGGNDYGDCFLKINPAGAVLDYFCPSVQSNLLAGDLDLGAGGVLLLPDQSGAHPHEMVSAGKNGTIYLVDRDNMMGHYQTNADQIVESVVNAFPNNLGDDGGNFCSPVYFNGNVYFSPVQESVQAFQLSNGLLSTNPISSSSEQYGGRGGTMAISANGNSNGILWVLESTGTASPGVLHAYDATNLGNELYNSNQAGTRDMLDAWLKFNLPLVANGKVYVETESMLSVFGNFVAVPTIVPNGGTFTNTVLVSLTNATPGSVIYYTLDNTDPTTNSALYTGPFSQTTSATVDARAYLDGVTESAVASADFTIISLQPPSASFSASPTNGAATLLVNFTDASSGTVTGRVWTFGDGSTSALTSPSHPYTNAGSFSVSLTVSGPLGSNTQLLANYITVTNLIGAPVVGFIANPTNGAAPLLVSFTDASGGAITNHSWTFGDGNTSAAVSPTHTYSNAGLYSVALTVSGPGGSSATNLANLITVTNLVGTTPTVTIVRPANGMLYPATFTNQTITIVASATANDSGSISEIEFFADGVKIGETTSSPGTNFLVNPTLGSHAITGRATDTLGATNTSPTTTITVGAKNSPLGDWEVTIRGADRGAQFLTFGDDFSASGYGIRLKTFGIDDVSGQWGFNSKGQITGPFVEQTDSLTNWTGTLLGTGRAPKTVTGTVKTTDLGTFHWRGIPATTFPDLSGTWTGLVTVVRAPTEISYQISSNADESGVFDIAVSTDAGTVVGQLLATSRNEVYGYVTFDSKQIDFSGTYNARRLSLTLRGTDTAAERISIRIFKQ